MAAARTGLRRSRKASAFASSRPTARAARRRSTPVSQRLRAQSFVIHLDTEVPEDACAVVAQTLDDARVALAGFTPLIAGPLKTRWVSTFHNWIKTWYAPMIFRPISFLRGLRLLFGDHAMFFRKADFERIGGLDPAMMIMEDADLCEKLAKIGRVRLIDRVVITSDRRIARWGALRANWIYFKVGLLGALGLHRAAGKRYPDVR